MANSNKKSPSTDSVSEPKFTVARLRGESASFFNQPHYIAVGAFYGLQDDKLLTVAEAQRRINKFSGVTE